MPAALSGSPCVFKLTVILYSQVPPEEGLSPDTLYSGFFQVLSCSLSNPPVFILNSSGKVPGLAVGGFLEFITLCYELPAEGWGGGQVFFWGGGGHTCAQLVLRPQPPKLQSQEVLPVFDSGLGLLVRLFPPRGQARSHFLSWGFSLSRLLGPRVGWTPSCSALRFLLCPEVWNRPGCADPGQHSGQAIRTPARAVLEHTASYCMSHPGFETLKCSSGHVPALALTSLSQRGTQR